MKKTPTLHIKSKYLVIPVPNTSFRLVYYNGAFHVVFSEQLTGNAVTEVTFWMNELELVTRRISDERFNFDSNMFGE